MVDSSTQTDSPKVPSSSTPVKWGMHMPEPLSPCTPIKKLKTSKFDLDPEYKPSELSFTQADKVEATDCIDLKRYYRPQNVL